MGANIEQLLKETRAFSPSPLFQEHARISSLDEYNKKYQLSIERPDVFWGQIAGECHWFKSWTNLVDETKKPFVRWFVGGTTNITYNCLDRHLPHKARQTALLWEGEPADEKNNDRLSWTFSELHRDVCKTSNMLKSLGVKKGDRVIIYMPMVPELLMTVLACARIGAVHSVIFGGFSAPAIVDRVNDAEAAFIVTADGGYRKGKVVELKSVVDEALQHVSCVKKVLVLRRTGTPIAWIKDRDCEWKDLFDKSSSACPAEEMDAEDPLFILYTSGSTGKPKGILHTTGGYMVGAYLSTRYIFDVKDSDVFWCTADVGWVTGHSYVVYGALLNGVTTLMYEGAPNQPEPDRFWSIVERYKVTVFYTAPTAIRTFMKWGDAWVKKHNLSSLRLLGSVGEPINPEAWMWYHKIVGQERCPIVDTWWQTETGSIMIAPLPGVWPAKPGSATRPFFGVAADVVDEAGNSLPVRQGGLLVIKKPWPSMLRGIYRDETKYRETYWQKFAKQGWYFAGDGAFKDEDGYFWIMGRIDDVLNVSGHRLSTMEVESALVSHPMVVEAAVVGYPHDIKGDGIAAFVITSSAPKEEDKNVLREHVAKEIGALAKPDQIRFTSSLPKTRSGKIMRRLLRDIAAGREMVGDTSTLEDYSGLMSLREEQE